MKKHRLIATTSIIVASFSLLSMLFVMLALQDIYHGNEPSLISEWNVVRIGFLVFAIFHIFSLISNISLLRINGKNKHGIGD